MSLETQRIIIIIIIIIITIYINTHIIGSGNGIVKILPSGDE